jgi:hypothetical protein
MAARSSLREVTVSEMGRRLSTNAAIPFENFFG